MWGCTDVPINSLGVGCEMTFGTIVGAIRITVAVNLRVDTFGGWFERLAQTQSGATTLKTKIEVH